jgi:hypothetical protein
MPGVTVRWARTSRVPSRGASGNITFRSRARCTPVAAGKRAPAGCRDFSARGGRARRGHGFSSRASVSGNDPLSTRLPPAVRINLRTQVWATPQRHYEIQFGNVSAASATWYRHYRYFAESLGRVACFWTTRLQSHVRLAWKPADSTRAEQATRQSACVLPVHANARKNLEKGMGWTAIPCVPSDHYASESSLSHRT